MSNILNAVKNVIASSIKVEVKPAVTRSGKTRFPVLVTDVSNSFTSGWFVQYNPVAQQNSTRLYDGAESFSELHIARFSELYNLTLTGNYYFLQGHGVEVMSDNVRRRAIYEPTPAVRLTVTSQANSVSVFVTIVDENSPFHMMSIPFSVTNRDAQPYVVGTDKYWDRNTDTFQDTNANFAPRKARFHRVSQQNNGPATLRGAKLGVRNGQYAINQDGSFEIDAQASSPEYIQVINSEYKALAYIYEQALMATAFEMALAQGLPTAQVPQQTGAPQAPAASSGFVPAFSIPMSGQPNPVQPQQPAQPQPQAPVYQAPPAPVNNQMPAYQVPLSNQQPQPQPAAPGGYPAPPQTPVSSDDLPWDTK